jgi:excinuclease ABC subunit A
MPEARARGFKAGRFSFNVKGGRCEACQGDGVIAIEMHFLPDVYVTCEQCKGRRYNRETLEIKYRGKSIADVLDLTVDQALPLLENFPPVANKLRTLRDVGLGYIELGQSATTLSGGEAQRVKLAKELSKRGTGRTLYILDEPTTGLHFEDTRKLLDVLNKLVEQGNTIVVIEHNLDVIKWADHVIDLGPEGGAAGGRIVAEGTPEEVAQDDRSASLSVISGANGAVSLHRDLISCDSIATTSSVTNSFCVPQTVAAKAQRMVPISSKQLSNKTVSETAGTGCRWALSLLSSIAPPFTVRG